MPMPRLIPSLLLRGGRLVKGVRFTDYRDAGRHDTTARAHDAQGADELIVLDIQASTRHRGPDVGAIRSVTAECSMPVTVGGGIRSLDDAEACMATGADKLLVNVGALDHPALITELAGRYGSQAVVLGIDVTDSEGERAVFDHRSGSASGRGGIDWAREGIRLGAGEIRLMAVDREGSRAGMDLDLLDRIRRAVDVPIILEGGAGALDHVDAAFSAGADGVALGTMLVFSDNNIVKIKGYLAGRGHGMRL